MGLLRPSVEEALAAWGRRVRENREQVDRVREVEDGADFYGPVSSMFRADPRREDHPALEVLRSLVESGETWLDIGAGGGRYALPLALLAGEVIALDPSEGMLAVLREGMAEHGIQNVRIMQSRWPPAEPVGADVALIAHVGYDIEAIGPFLDGMEAAASRLCVAVLLERQPTWTLDALWPGGPRPAAGDATVAADFLALQATRGRACDVRRVGRTQQSYESLEQAIAFARRQTWVRGGDKDLRLQAVVAERLIEQDGRYALSWEPTPVGIVTWEPPSAADTSQGERE